MHIRFFSLFPSPSLSFSLCAIWHRKSQIGHQLQLCPFPAGLKNKLEVDIEWTLSMAHLSLSVFCPSHCGSDASALPPHLSLSCQRLGSSMGWGAKMRRRRKEIPAYNLHCATSTCCCCYWAFFLLYFFAVSPLFFLLLQLMMSWLFHSLLAVKWNHENRLFFFPWFPSCSKWCFTCNIFTFNIFSQDNWFIDAPVL